MYYEKKKCICRGLHYTTLRLYGGRTTEARWYKTAGTLVRGSTKAIQPLPLAIIDMNT